MIHIDWITPDDIVLKNNILDNNIFRKYVKRVKKIRLLRIGDNYYLRYDKDNLPFWAKFSFYKNNNIYFGDVSIILSGFEQYECDYKTLHREEVLRNILG